MAEVSELHVHYVRAMLSGDANDYASLERAVRREPVHSRKTLETYINAVFQHAAGRRFSTSAARADIIRFVARARTSGALDSGDSRCAEQLLLFALQFDTEPRQALDPAATSRAMSGLLAALLAMPPDSQETEVVLAESRYSADRAILRSTSM